MLLNTVILCHWIGVFWHFLAKMEINYLDYTDTWLHKQDVLETEWYVRYIYSFYWSASTIMLVGPIAHNYIEIAFTSVILLSTVGVFAYILNTISQILGDMNKAKEIYIQDFKTINKFMRKKGISKDLQGKIRNYLDYYFESHSAFTQNQDAQQVLDRIPKLLRDELLFEINEKIITQFQTFKNCFSRKSFEALTTKFEEVQYLPSEILFKQGQIDNNTLYLIKRGKIELYESNKKNLKTRLSTCHDGDIIGHYQFFTGRPSRYSAKCITSCEIYQISRKDMIDVMQQDQDDFEKAIMIKDDLKFKGYSQHIPDYNCLVCKDDKHIYPQCPQIFFIPNRLRVVKMDHKHNLQVREPFDRNFRIKIKNQRQYILLRLQESQKKIFANPDLRILIFELIDQINQQTSNQYSISYQDLEYEYEDLDEDIYYTEDEEEEYEDDEDYDYYSEYVDDYGQSSIIDASHQIQQVRERCKSYDTNTQYSHHSHLTYRTGQENIQETQNEVNPSNISSPYNQINNQYFVVNHSPLPFNKNVTRRESLRSVSKSNQKQKSVQNSENKNNIIQSQSYNNRRSSIKSIKRKHKNSCSTVNEYENQSSQTQKQYPKNSSGLTNQIGSSSQNFQKSKTSEAKISSKNMVKSQSIKKQYTQQSHKFMKSGTGRSLGSQYSNSKYLKFQSHPSSIMSKNPTTLYNKYGSQIQVQKQQGRSSLVRLTWQDELLLKKNVYEQLFWKFDQLKNFKIYKPIFNQKNQFIYLQQRRFKSAKSNRKISNAYSRVYTGVKSNA